MAKHDFKVGDWVKVTKPTGTRYSSLGVFWSSAMDYLTKEPAVQLHAEAKFGKGTFDVLNTSKDSEAKGFSHWTLDPEWLTPAQAPVPAPPEGYTLLEPGELVKQGDVFWSPISKSWRRVAGAGDRGREGCPGYQYARQITAPASVPLFPETLVYQRKVYVRKAESVTNPGDLVLSTGQEAWSIYEAMAVTKPSAPCAVYEAKPPAPKPLWETLDCVPKRVRLGGDDYYLETNAHYVPKSGEGQDRIWNTNLTFRLSAYNPASLTDGQNVGKLARVHKFLVYRKSTKGS